MDLGIGTIITSVTVVMIVVFYAWNWYKKNKQDKTK